MHILVSEVQRKKKTHAFKICFEMLVLVSGLSGQCYMNKANKMS